MGTGVAQETVQGPTNATRPWPWRASAMHPPRDSMPSVREPAWVQTMQYIARPIAFLERNSRRYGDVFRARIYGLGTGRTVFVSDPALIEQLYKTSGRAVSLGEVAREPIVPLIGPGSLLALDGAEHLAHRKILLPPFHGERMRAYAEIMARAADRSIAEWPVGEPFALRPRFVDITMEVMMRAVFGLEPGSRLEHLAAVVARVINPTPLPLLALIFPSLRRDLGPVQEWSRFQRCKREADTLIHEEIARRRRAPDLDRRADILSTLLDTPLTDSEIKDELLTIMIAGHETTATALSWAFDLLLHNPAVLSRLREDLAHGSDAYLDAVVHEVLRLRPVVLTSQRVVAEPVELGDHAIEAGETIFVPIWQVHRRPDLYPDPYAFRPERFLERRPSTYEWIPFGGGVRRCIGANFAPMEMKIVIGRVLAQALLEPARRELEQPSYRVVLVAPRDGTVVVRRG